MSKPGPKGITEKQIEKALRKCGGYTSVVAKKLKCTARNIDDRVLKSPHLTKVKAEIREAQLDFTESKLMANIKAGKEASIFFHLKCMGKERGYIEKQTVYVSQNNEDGKDETWKVEVVSKKID